MAHNVYWCPKCKSQWRANLQYPLGYCAHCSEDQPLILIHARINGAATGWYAYNDADNDPEIAGYGTTSTEAITDLIRQIGGNHYWFHHWTGPMIKHEMG